MKEKVPKSGHGIFWNRTNSFIEKKQLIIVTLIIAIRIPKKLVFKAMCSGLVCVYVKGPDLFVASMSFLHNWWEDLF